ncbi:MAG: putative Erf [Prokaryotic dsDNA virus sp.]|nr:MAG: putative Erf [Prokaryotic dsDNA virus sp.]|tara:strand:- start:3528 stop:4499 length:972 start_codon:yes stop_codon:yes gene_type:complete
MSENQKIKELLLAETPKDRVKFRIGRKYANNQRAHMLAYVDARYVQDRLDEVIGSENWSNSFEVIDNTLFCAITVVFPDGKAVTKTDCGTESNVEKEKGEASDAFKRAAVMLGIGRDLYDLPNHFNMHADLNEKGFPPKDWTPQGWGDHNHKEQRHVQDNQESPQKPQPSNENPTEEKSDLQSYADSIAEKHMPDAPDDPPVETSFVNEKPKAKKESNTEYVVINNLRLDHETDKSRLLVPSNVAKGSEETKGFTYWLTKQHTKELIRMNSGLYSVVVKKWILKDKPYEFEDYDQKKVHDIIEQEAQADQNKSPAVDDDDLPF